MTKAEENIIDTGAQPEPATTAPNWDSDPENPRNFTLKRRVASTAAVSFLAFVSTLAGSIYAPSHDVVSGQFQVSDEVGILPLALFNAGLAFGPLLGAPLCETFGRKVVFLTTTPVFALFILGAGFSQSISSLVICRFFAGVFASPAISNASATITDYTAGRYRAISLAFYYSIPFFGAVFGPLLGGLIVESKGWRWTQWTTLFFIIAFIIPVLFTKETYKKTILERRARRNGVRIASPHSQQSVINSARYFLTTLFLRPLHMLFTEPIVSLICLYNGFMFGLMYTFVVASPWVFEHYYQFSRTGQSLSFLGLIVGTLLAPPILITIDLTMYQPRLKRWRMTQQPHSASRFPPENRLFPAIIAAPILPAALLLFAWTSRPSIHYVIPIIFQGISILASLLIYASANLFMLDSYGPLYGASAAGAAMLSRYSLSTAFPLFALRMYQSLGVGWATTILACCSAAMAPIPVLFWRYGEGLRRRMRYESSA
ncbi:hypothetical protein LTR05_005270 [Lithohypha guttulata]|uniref:Major facilitator superfamily (MFS) profile domain-containing protein n=1 Tax=Lithohypha guttulata TaxID=1690604 RepID=A0AAN7YHB8_9EURO|nr:hypothetical protein LTR05_005270 [Lithohypha guttulata]